MPWLLCVLTPRLARMYLPLTEPGILGAEGGLPYPAGPLGPLGSSSSQHRRTPEIVLKKDHASFRITSGPPVQSIAAAGGRVKDMNIFLDIDVS